MNIHDMLLATEQEVLNAFKRKAVDQGRDWFESDEIDEFLFIEGDLSNPDPVCIVAHVDHLCRVEKSLRYLKEDCGIITGWKKNPVRDTRTILGADDRAGCYAALELMDHVKRPFILITNHEEVGGVGAKIFAKSNLTEMYGIKFFIEFDRKGCNKYVQYNNNPPEVHEFMAKFRIDNDGRGSYSDIASISNATDVPSVNLACGYTLQHTDNEYLDILAMHLAIDKCKLMLSEIPKGGFGKIAPYVAPKHIPEYTYDPSWFKKPVQQSVSFLPSDWCDKCYNYKCDCVCGCFHCGYPQWQCVCPVKSIEHHPIVTQPGLCGSSKQATTPDQKKPKGRK